MVVRASVNQGQTLEDYIRTPNFDPSIIKSEQDIVSSGLKGKQIVQQRSSDASMLRIIYLQKGAAVYTISVTPADSELIPVFDQMLQSFKLLSDKI